MGTFVANGTFIPYSVEDSGEGEEEMDMDLESEEDDGPARPIASSSSSSKPRSKPTEMPGRNPYPLEGKYVDEDDREKSVQSYVHAGSRHSRG